MRQKKQFIYEIPLTVVVIGDKEYLEDIETIEQTIREEFQISRGSSFLEHGGSHYISAKIKDDSRLILLEKKVIQDDSE